MKQIKRISFFLAVIVILSIFTACSSSNGGGLELPGKDAYLGDWEATLETMQGKLSFKVEGDKHVAVWQINNYDKGTWSEREFEVNRVNDFSMTCLMDDGTIGEYGYAISKDTLYFDGVPYKNLTKNFGISQEIKDKTIVIDGVITPVFYDRVFLGMSFDEVVANAWGTLEERDTYSNHNTCYDLPEFITMSLGDVSGWTWFDFSDDNILEKCRVHLFNSIYSEKSVTNATVDTIKNHGIKNFGEYTESQRDWTNESENREYTYYTYVWQLDSGYYTVEVEYVKGTTAVEGISIIYSINNSNLF